MGLRVGGGIIFLIGLGHIFMTTYGYPPEITALWENEIKDHFYYLATYYICGSLLVLGTLSLLLSFRKPDLFSFYFSLCLTLLWALRFALEIIYPVSVPIYFLNYPHPVLLVTLDPVLLVTLGCVLICYLIAVSAVWKLLK